MPTRDLWAAAAAAVLALCACDRGGAPTVPAASTAPAASAPPSEAPGATSAAPAPAAPAGAAAPAQAAPTTTAPGATAAAPPAPAPPSAATLLQEAVALEPGGAAVKLAPGAETVVDPSATFRLELSAAAPDARLQLLDAADALVAATASSEVGATTRLTLQPAAPLTPAARYRLQLDGAVTRELHGPDGRAFAPAAFPLLAAGTPPPRPEPKAKSKRKHRR